jgi:zinc protease
MIAIGIRIVAAYALLGLTTAALVANVPAAGAQSTVATQPRVWQTERPPRPLDARPVKFPPYEIRKLSNGLQVVIVSHHEQPAVTVRLVVRAGAARDPKGKMGVAMLTAALLDQGAANRTAEQIADAIDFVGGILDTGAGTDLSYVDTVVLKDSLALGLQLMADVVRRPTFAPDEIERQRQQAMSGLQVAAEDPDNLASQIIDRLIYGFHPYGLPGTGTAESLAGLTRQDFVQFHQQYYVPNNALIAVVGDIKPDEALAGLEKAFGDWQPREVAPFQPIDPPAPTRRLVVIDKPDAVQTEIRVGQVGIPRKHQDFLPMDQAVKILGGEGANRLQQVLRSQRGLTYGASADLETYRTAGGIVAETDTRTEATAEVLRVTIDEFYRLQRERVFDGELQGAQAYLAGHFPLTIETPNAIAAQVLNQLVYELPLEDLQTYPERVRSVTPDDVQRVARAYFRPDRLSIVLVGNADAFIRDLKGVGFGEFERIPMSQVDLLAADLRKGGPRVGDARGAAIDSLQRRVAYQDRAAQAPDDAQRLAALIRKAVDAHGGLDALKGVKALVAQGTTTLTTPEGPISATTRTTVEYPGRVRVEAKLPDAEIVQVYADGTGWLKDPGGVRDAPPEMLRDFQAGAYRDPIALLRGVAMGTLTAKLLPEAGDGGRVLRVFEVTGEGLAPLRAYIDSQTGRLVKIGYSTRIQGAVYAEEVFDDYRMVDGVAVPFKASVVRGDVTVMSRTLTEITINPSLPADTFTRPVR